MNCRTVVRVALIIAKAKKDEVKRLSNGTIHSNTGYKHAGMFAERKEPHEKGHV
jgi:hypothetical protein